MKTVLQHFLLFALLLSVSGGVFDGIIGNTSTGMATLEPRYQAIANHLYDSEKGERGIYFLGTSRTQGNVVPKIINSAFKTDGTDLEAWNLGVNWFGADMSYILCERVINRKRPKVVVVEVPYLHRYFGHKNFSMVCRFSEAITAPIWGNRDWIRNVVFTPFRQFHQLLISWKDLPNPLLENNGHYLLPISEERKIELKTSFKKKIMDLPLISSDELNPGGQLGRWRKEVLNHPTTVWYRRIVELCKKNNVRLIFLGIPKFRMYEMGSEDRLHYSSLALFIEPPVGLLHREDCWRDEAHYTKIGAEIFSNWLGETIIEALKKPDFSDPYLSYDSLKK